MSSKKVLVIGELNVDILLNNIQGFPKIGTEIMAASMNTVLGSSSAIFASNLASLGTEVTFCGTIGDDNNADLVIKSLKRNNVNTQFIKKIQGEKTGATIILNYEQDRANITFGGAMNSLTPELIPLSRVKEFDHVHISNFFIQKGIRNHIIEIFKKLKETGVSTSLDMQWDVEEKWDYDFKNGLPYVDIFLPNESEVLRLTQTPDISQAIQKIQPYSGILAIKRGIQGSIGINKKQQEICAAYKFENFVDAIGAGDSFNAGFIFKYLQGASLMECLKMGNKAGAINTTEAGGTKAFESKEALQKKLSQLS